MDVSEYRLKNSMIFWGCAQLNVCYPCLVLLSVSVLIFICLFLLLLCLSFGQVETCPTKYKYWIISPPFHKGDRGDLALKICV